MTAGGLRIAELCQDREGNIWAATGESGLIQVRARRANVLSVTDGLSDRTAFSVLQDRSGSWWVGSKSGGVDRITNGVVSHVTIGEGGLNRPVSALFEDRDGVLWAATRNGSVFRLQDGVFRPAFNGPDAPSKVTGIAQNSVGALWFAGLQGLARSSGGKLTRIALDDAPDISTLAIDAQDQLWIGTSQGKLFHGAAEKLVAIDPGNQFPVRAISSVHIDAGGSVWISSVGGGLMLWRAGRLTRISTAAGLPDSRLTAVLDDGAGNLWLGSLGGIFRVAKAELNAIADGQQTSANWLQFDRADGLLSRECTGIFQPAACRGADGSLWFPTVNGVAQIRPDHLALNPLPPKVAIEACAENGKRIQLSPERLRLGPGRTRLEFRYTALSLTASEKIRFRVRLDGLENEWRDVGALREVAYEAVPAGRYEFQVMAANADGVWAKSAAGVLVEVRPHFWETQTFRVLAGLAAAAAAATIGWLVARARLKQRLLALELRHAREAERARIARDLHDDLGASLTEISMLAEVTAEETPSQAAREPLEQIAARAHALVGALDEIVWAVNPRHDTLDSLADYLAATAADFVAAAGLPLRLDVPRDLPACEVDAERRHSVLLAVREALHNVIKHSGADEVWLRMKVSSGVLEIVVEDKGCGFDTGDKYSGDGLPNLAARLASIGGEYHVTSTVGSGTCVLLRVPLGPETLAPVIQNRGEPAIPIH
jgi:signal transduction histidine kinase